VTLTQILHVLWMLQFRCHVASAGTLEWSCKITSTETPWVAVVIVDENSTIEKRFQVPREKVEIPSV
jgi:hypothetical protein